MIGKQQFTRRHFLKTTAALAGSAPFLLPSSVWAAEAGAKPNSKIVMGFIGTGKQGRYLLGNFLRRSEVQVVAICDVDTTRREHHTKMVDDYYSKKGGAKQAACKQYPDFRDLLARKDIDAVCIAVPDHWHAIPPSRPVNRARTSIVRNRSR